MLNKIFNKPKKKSYGVKAMQLGGFLEQVFYGGRVTASKAAQYYRQSSAVAISVDTIADEIEQIIPVVEKSDGSLDDSHPVLELLSNPNDFDDYRTFIGQAAREYLLNHDTCFFAEGNINRPPVNLFSLKMQNISITQNASDGYADSYMVSSGMGRGKYTRSSRNREMRFYDTNMMELYHVRGYSSRSENTTSDSPLEAAALEAQQQILGRNHNLKLIQNGGKLSMAVIVKGDEAPSEEDFNNIKEQVYNQFEGSDNAGKIAVFAASDMDIQEMGMNNRDMDFDNLDKTASNCIYMRYKIPLPLVSPDRQTYNNFDRAIEDLYDRAVLPHVKILFSGLTKMLKARYGDTFESITYDEEQISALRGRMIEELKKRKEIGIETINELRQLLPNRDEIEGGDTLYISAGQIPVGEDIFGDSEVDLNDALMPDES